MSVINKAIITTVKNINFGYSKDDSVLKNINFNIYENETLGILGANGAGKSTLLKLLPGLLKSNSGIINICGMDLNSKNLKKIRDKIGYLFQNADNQLFMPTVYEDIAFSLKNKHTADITIDEVVKNSLDKVHASHLVNKSSGNMSGGEKRLVTLAVVLADNPDLLIMDEPTVGLDPKSRRNFLSLVKDINKSKIIATHDMDLVLEICDRVIIINNGEIITTGTPKDIFENRNLLYENNLEPPLSILNCPVCGKVKE